MIFPDGGIGTPLKDGSSICDNGAVVTVFTDGW